MIQAITLSILHGFAIYSLVGFIAGFFLSPKTKEKADQFDVSACQIGALAGFIYLVLSSVDTLSLGRYAIPVWIQLLMIGSVQLLWVLKLRTVRWLRLVIAGMLLFSLEGWIGMITSMNREYMPLDGGSFFLTLLYVWITSSAVFALAAGLFHAVKTQSRPSR
jgi:hypothetical protein